MLIDTLVYSDHWDTESSSIASKEQCNLVLLFGDADTLKSESVFDELKKLYPNAQIIGASSAGNILGSEVRSSPVIATAVQFQKGHINTATVDFSVGDDIEGISEQLISQLLEEDLKHIFILSDGLNINGSALVRGINKITEKISTTGGMAGDGNRFQETLVISNAPAKQCRIVAVGFYGEGFSISSGCFAGWSEFGGDRLVTKSSGSVVYELDNAPALDVYKKHIGSYADDLPNSGMRFPLSIKLKKDDPEVIRTLLDINEEDKSIIFAGDVPEGYTVRLMKPHIDMLIDGAKMAAEEVNKVNKNQALGLVVSCTGRKIIMNDLVEEELETLEEILGKNVQLAGFYSYGEIAPFSNDLFTCELHNQTMTLTAIYEQ